MKNILKLEELAMFLFSIYLFNQLPYAWWVYPACILLPDIGMLGYAVNASVGALTYNLFHHKGVALLIYVAGVVVGTPAIQLTGIILFGHASMDRILGYGLKYPDSFMNTHLGKIGKEKEAHTA